MFPPRGCECLTFCIKIGESDPEIHGESGEEDEERVEEDESGLCNERILESDEEGTEKGRSEGETEREEGEECDGDQSETEDGWEESHHDVWYSRFDIVPGYISIVRFDQGMEKLGSLSDIFEVEIAIKSTNLRSEGDEELCQRRMNVHEEDLSYVLACEPSKMNFIKPDHSSANHSRTLLYSATT